MPGPGVRCPLENFFSSSARTRVRVLAAFPAAQAERYKRGRGLHAEKVQSISCSSTLDIRKNGPHQADRPQVHRWQGVCHLRPSHLRKIICRISSTAHILRLRVRRPLRMNACRKYELAHLKPDFFLLISLFSNTGPASSSPPRLPASRPPPPAA